MHRTGLLDLKDTYCVLVGNSQCKNTNFCLQKGPQGTFNMLRLQIKILLFNFNAITVLQHSDYEILKLHA